jgi:predicted O-methyltransferase YrrM
MSISPMDLMHKLYETRIVSDANGVNLPLEAEVRLPLAEALYRVVSEQKPNRALEIGMAHGMSTLAILGGLRAENPGGTLISVDPHQSTAWRGVGLANVRLCDMSAQHRIIEEPDYIALPSLLQELPPIDFGYVDGWHTVDHVMLDFFYVDKMLRPGGIVGFNDCGYPAVHKALRFIKTHRKYAEIDVGLEPDYRASNAAKSMARRILRRNNNDRYFRKLENWEPNWNFYSFF